MELEWGAQFSLFPAEVKINRRLLSIVFFVLQTLPFIGASSILEAHVFPVLHQCFPYILYIRQTLHFVSNWQLLYKSFAIFFFLLFLYSREINHISFMNYRVHY